MKKLALAVILLAAVMLWGNRAEALPVNCIVCGSTALTGPTVDGTISFAVISGQDFLNEVAAHNIGFSGLVPGGSLDAVPNNTAPTDFVYLYQTVNTGPNQSLISTYEVSRGAAIAPADITGGGRLESTLFEDPGIGVVSTGFLGSTTGLSGGPTVDFRNGLFDPFGPTWGPCLGSAGAANCSDATANLLAGSIEAVNFGETPSQPLLDPVWSSSIMWYSTPIAPGFNTATIFDVAGNTASGLVAAPAVPEPSSLLLLGSGLIGLAGWRWRKNRAGTS